MANKVHSYNGIFPGLTATTKMVVPVLGADPSSPAEGQFWLRSDTDELKFYDGDEVKTIGTVASLTTEEVQDVVGAMVVDSSTVDATYNDGAGTLSLAVLDSPTLQGSNKATVISEAVAAIVDTAPSTLDTLNELAAALGDDPNFATSITALINARARGYAATLTGGAATETVTHNLGTRDVQVTVYVNSGDYEEEGYIVKRPTTNTVQIVSEAGNIPSGRRVVVTAPGT